MTDAKLAAKANRHLEREVLRAMRSREVREAVMSVVAEVVAGMVRVRLEEAETEPRILPPHIAAVAAEFRVPISRMRNTGYRHKTYCQARAAACWLLRSTGMGWADIAAAVGMVNHTSAMAAVRVVEARPSLLARARKLADAIGQGEERRAA